MYLNTNLKKKETVLLISNISIEKKLSQRINVIPNFHNDKEIEKQHDHINEMNILLMKMKIIQQ